MLSRRADIIKSAINVMTYVTNFKLVILLDAENAKLPNADLNTSIDTLESQ